MKIKFYYYYIIILLYYIILFFITMFQNKSSQLIIFSNINIFKKYFKILWMSSRQLKLQKIKLL